MDRQDLIDAIHEALDSRKVPEDLHAEHHDWLRVHIEKDRARAAFWQDLARKSIPMIALSLLGALGAFVWRLLTTHIHWS